MTEHYYLYTDDGWIEVTKKEYVEAERAAGFYNTIGQPNEPATSYWSNGIKSGRIVYI